MGGAIPFLDWVPAISSAILLFILSRDGLGRRPWIFYAWGGLAFLLQFGSGMFSPAWAVGLAAQSALAVTLAVKRRLESLG